MTVGKKVGAGGLAGAATVVLVWVLNAAAGLDVPPEVASAVTTILSFVVAWLVPNEQP